jgi:hypothetical protein
MPLESISGHHVLVMHPRKITKLAVAFVLGEHPKQVMFAVVFEHKRPHLHTGIVPVREALKQEKGFGSAWCPTEQRHRLRNQRLAQFTQARPRPSAVLGREVTLFPIGE